MTRTSVDQFDLDGRLVNGFDYIHQAYTDCDNQDESLLRQWVAYADGLMDARQLRKLVKASRVRLEKAGAH